MISASRALALFAVLFLLWPAAMAQGASVKVQNPVPYAKDADVPEKARAECELGEKLATFLAEYDSGVELVSGKPSGGRVLGMEITNVHAPGGGAFSGPKWMEVKGTLRDGGKTVGSFRAKRYSTGGAFATFKGTCSIVGRCAKAIAKDIAEWLESPTRNAALGNAKE